jgi:Antirepressor regulating drug resistance, predicted signal transduction N-terminal membrane component
MALLTSSLLVGLIAFIFLHNKTMVCAGYQLLGVFIGLAVIRLFVPFEFPFTDNVPFSQMFSKAIFFFRHPQIQIFDIKLSICNLFEGIWIIGIIFNLIRYICQFCFAKDYILKYGTDLTEETIYKTILDNICIQHNRKNNFHIVNLPDMRIPIIFGMKNPYIILPAGISIPTDKLYYILYHESMHHFYHDLLIKGIIRILSIIYWWNPAFIVLYKQVDIILEMRIDKKITHNETEITGKYAECLLYMKRKAINQSSQSSTFLKKNSCYLMQSQNKDLKKRFYMLLQDDYAVSKKIFTSIVLTALMAGIYVSSYLFVLEAYYYPPQFEEMLFVPSPENTYFIQNDASNYEVYINGFYFETVDSIDNYPVGIKIYNKKGESLNEN